MKWELEDLSFRYLEPEKYYDLVDQMKQKRQVREDIVNDTMRQITKALSEAHIKADIKGRPKHFYSIYKKMKKDNRDLSQIYDLLAIQEPGAAMQPFDQILYRRFYFLLYIASEQPHHIQIHGAFPKYGFESLPVAPSCR